MPLSPLLPPAQVCCWTATLDVFFAVSFDGNVPTTTVAFSSVVFITAALRFAVGRIPNKERALQIFEGVVSLAAVHLGLAFSALQYRHRLLYNMV